MQTSLSMMKRNKRRRLVILLFLELSLGSASSCA